MRLVIAEKPSVAKTIAEVIGARKQSDGYLEGSGYLVSWCIGHLVELVNADIYKDEWKKWSYGSLPILPETWKYSVKKGTEGQYKVLADLLNREIVSEVICATDAGREGELIFRLVYEQAGCRKPVKRLWISSMEGKAIQEGFGNLKEGADYDNLYRSALCRSKADWLVGINATRLFTVLYGHTLTVGRVQTPTLSMLVEREQKIKEFVKEKYFTVRLMATDMEAVSSRIANREDAEQIAGKCRKGQAVVTAIIDEEKVIHPPRLYDLTTLQREANRIFGYTAQQTLDLTQSLYEKKLVTYPRTDSQFLTEDMEQTAEAVIGIVQQHMDFTRGISYQPDIKRILNNGKVSDHHGIIPTVEIGKTDLNKVPGSEYSILSLVAGKLICATGEKHIYHSIKAVLECKGENFTATGRTVLQEGFKGFEKEFLKFLKAEEQPGKEEKVLPQLSQGMVIPETDTKITEHYTSPPKHYTEDTLLSAMEHAGNEGINEDVERMGLGTPATRAAIIEKLVKKGFLKRSNKQMLPTENGSKLIAVLPDVVKSPELTAEWENDLALIAKGEKQAEDFMDGIKEMVLDLVKNHCEAEASHKKMFENEQEVIGRCPKCGGNVYESKVNFYCGDKECKFSLYKNNKYFASMKKELSKEIASSLLDKGRVRVRDLYSAKKGKNFTATIMLDASGDYPKFSLEFDTYKPYK